MYTTAFQTKNNTLMEAKKSFFLTALSQNYLNNYENNDCTEAPSTKFFGSVS
jgi:hypothetical protein